MRSGENRRFQSWRFTKRLELVQDHVKAALDELKSIGS